MYHVEKKPICYQFQRTHRSQSKGIARLDIPFCMLHAELKKEGGTKNFVSCNCLAKSHDSDDPIYPITKSKMHRLPESRKNAWPENTLVIKSQWISIGFWSAWKISGIFGQLAWKSTTEFDCMTFLKMSWTRPRRRPRPPLPTRATCAPLGWFTFDNLT